MQTNFMKNIPLLSIAIPAYDRPKELIYSLTFFISQISGKYENDIEIIISDDCSPNDSLHEIRYLASKYHYIKFRRYPKNIGLEQNLIKCSDICTGKYLWLFGDDDFLECSDSLDIIINTLKKNDYEFVILNRTRRTYDLSEIISSNWMKLEDTKNRNFVGLREFCLMFGFISIIGFISVNIFKRKNFQSVNASKYLGTMYPQLGTMLEAFHNKKTLLISKPLICQRTQTPEQKKISLGAKKKESDFMSNAHLRNAIYFSHPFIDMLFKLINIGALKNTDIVKIPENTVINGFLIDFLIQTVSSNNDMFKNSDHLVWLQTKQFFEELQLNSEQSLKVNQVFSSRKELI
ncbi:MAG: glycosyltransferase family 2 protein [Gammaproteobacteria bacterium]|nr:glycosyltransferase family 2 protein [Gammaproteobacteria bacterium]